jgi:uncharacterized cupredoxin-like copper-binding protein
VYFVGFGSLTTLKATLIFQRGCAIGIPQYLTRITKNPINVRIRTTNGGASLSHKPLIFAVNLNNIRGKTMPYKNKNDRDAKHEMAIETPKNKKARKVRQQARQLYDKLGIDRTGKDINHKASTRAGNARSNLELKSPSANRGYPRNHDHTPK